MEFYVIAACIAFLAAAAQALTGFGFALVLVPLLSLVFDPTLTVLVSLSLGLACKLPLFLQTRQHVRLRLIAPLTVAAFAGNALGTRLLLFADPNLMRFIIGLVVVVLCVPLLLNYRWQIKREGLATAVVGVVSGLLTGSTSMGGPPVVLFGVNQAWAKEGFRANLIAYFILTNLFTLALLGASGAFTEQVLLTDLVMLPGVALGLLAGNALFKRAPVELFHRVVVLFVIATGLFGAYSAATTLF